MILMKNKTSYEKKLEHNAIPIDSFLGGNISAKIIGQNSIERT